MVLFEIINPVSFLLQIALVVCKMLFCTAQKTHAHTVFSYSSCCCSVQLVFWQTRHFSADLWLDGVISIISHIHRHRLVLLFKSQYVPVLLAMLALVMKTKICQEIEHFQRVTRQQLPFSTTVSALSVGIESQVFKHGGKGHGEMEKGLCLCSPARNFSLVCVHR